MLSELEKTVYDNLDDRFESCCMNFSRMMSRLVFGRKAIIFPQCYILSAGILLLIDVENTFISP